MRRRSAGRARWAWACGSALQIGLQALEDRDRLAGTDLHDGLLPGARAPCGVAAALGLGLHAERADLDHVDVEELLDGLLDLGLVRVGVDAERVAVRRREDVGLLRDDGADDDLAGVHQALASVSARASPPACGLARAVLEPRAVSASIAACEATSVAAPTRSATPTASAGRTLT